jgi:hypothetical protein
MPPKPAFLIRAKSLAISSRSTEASGTQYLRVSRQHKSKAALNVEIDSLVTDLNRGLTCADGFSNVPNGMSGLIWSFVLKPLVVITHSAAITADLSTMMIL